MNIEFKVANVSDIKKLTEVQRQATPGGRLSHQGLLVREGRRREVFT
jgi:hypothetical protein